MARFKTDRTYVIVAISDVKAAWLTRAVIRSDPEFIQKDITKLRKNLAGDKVILKYRHIKGKPRQLTSEPIFTHELILEHIGDFRNGWVEENPDLFS